jgi:hypothetical protein
MPRAEGSCRGINGGPLFWHPSIAARVLELLIRHLPEVSEAIDDEMGAGSHSGSSGGNEN